MFKVLATYQGWSNAAYILGEVKDPIRTLKRAGPLGLGITGSLFILANVSYFACATPDEIKGSGVTVAAFFMGKVFGDRMRSLIAVFAALSSLGNVMAVTFSMSRVIQEVAKDGLIPWSRFWARSWTTGTPATAMLLVFFSSFIVIALVPAGKAHLMLHKKLANQAAKQVTHIVSS
jgi:amino acid transporter